MVALDKYTVIAAAAIVLIAASACIILAVPDPLSYEKDNVVFRSLEGNPKDALSSLSESASFLVSPSLEEQGGVNPYMSQGSSIPQVVLIGNGKTTILLARVYVGNQLSYCQTNDGDVKVSRRVEQDECEGMLNDNRYVSILIEPPANPEKSVVSISGRKITVLPSGYAAISPSAYALMSEMYPNTDEILNTVNDYMGQLG